MKTHNISHEDIVTALEKDKFVFYYQAKVSMLTGRICGAEALIRWVESDNKVILPDHFIPIAEKTGYISEISMHMFPKLVTDIRLVNDIDDSISIAFNASAQDFETPDFVDMVCNAVEKKIFYSNSLEIEVTEASLLSECTNVKQYLYTLTEQGISLTMDDFGEGYSTIAMLGKRPFSAIKIDRKIIKRMQTSEKDLAIIQSSIRMAHKLGIDIVAEGVEDWFTYNYLLQAGCTHAQGYLISKPKPLLAFLELIRDAPRWPALPVGLLHMAELDHIEWRKALMDAVFSYKHFKLHKNIAPQFTQFPELDHKACGLGKWYYGVGQEYTALAGFDVLEEPHERLHSIGRKLLNAVQKGASEKKIMKLLRKVSEDSATIIGLLQKLQNEAIVENGWPQMEAFKELIGQSSTEKI